MSIVSRLFEARNRIVFEREVRAIRNTPPARLAAAGPTVLSMVQHRDVDAYLLAVKSFLHHVPVARVVLVADPTLSGDDRAVIAEHVPGLSVREADSARRPGVPQGGTWERLLSIAEEVADSYVIQIDADTVTLGGLAEVRSSVDAGRAFLLAGERSAQIVTCAEAARASRAALGRSTHIQVLAESKLELLKDDRWRYARGCSGFSGFPRGSFDVSVVQSICAVMSGAVDGRWSEWGSEQFTSNLIAASQSGAVVLPHPKYCNADGADEGTEFLHFIGYTRFTSARYSNAARKVIQSLRYLTATSSR